MVKRLVVAVCVTVALAASAFAQEKPAPAKAKAVPPAASRASLPPPQPLNIKIEVSITDQTGSDAPARKVVTMIVGDQQSSSIRSSASLPVKTLMSGGTGQSTFNYRDVTINVDARPTILAKEPSKVRVGFGLQYLPKTVGSAEETQPGMAQLNESLSLILESGKPTVVSQAADPSSDRKIAVEVTATILK